MTSPRSASSPPHPADKPASDPKDRIPPVPPEQRKPPVEMPPDQPGKPAGEPDPPPQGDPRPNEPTRLV